jgi:hypothetical protein
MEETTKMMLGELSQTGRAEKASNVDTKKKASNLDMVHVRIDLG